MTKLNLSQKLFVDKKGKRYAYADEIQKAVRELKEKLFGRADYHKNHGSGLVLVRGEVIKIVDEAFGDKLSNSSQESSKGLHPKNSLFLKKPANT